MEAARRRDWDEALDIFTSHYDPSAQEYSTFLHVADRCNRVEEAEEIFARMPVQLSTYRVGAYTALMHIHGRLGNFDRTQELFAQLRSEKLSPDAPVYSCLLKAMSKQKGSTADAVMQAWQEMVSEGVQPNEACFANALNALAEAQRDDLARQIFDEMPKYGLVPSIVQWNLLLKARAFAEKADLAKQDFQEMMAAGVARDSGSFTSVLEALRRCGASGWQSEAEKLLEQLEAERILLDERLLRSVMSCRFGVKQDMITPVFLQTATDEQLRAALGDLQRALDAGVQMPRWARDVSHAVHDVLRSRADAASAAAVDVEAAGHASPEPVTAASEPSTATAPSANGTGSAGSDSPWVAVQSAEHGRYYWNKVTNVTQWQLPTGFIASETISA